MSKNWDLEVAELQSAYDAMQSAKGAIRSEVRVKYRGIIAAEIAERTAELEASFARTLAAVKERSGLPVTAIQEHVLRTKAWGAWTKWRDLAGLENERVAIRNAKEESAVARWADDYSVLRVLRGPQGAPLADGRYVELSQFIRKGFYERILGEFELHEADGSRAERIAELQYVTDTWGDWGKMFDAVAPMVRAAVEAGHIPVPPKKS